MLIGINSCARLSNLAAKKTTELPLEFKAQKLKVLHRMDLNNYVPTNDGDTP